MSDFVAVDTQMHLFDKIFLGMTVFIAQLLDSLRNFSDKFLVDIVTALLHFHTYLQICKPFLCKTVALRFPIYEYYLVCSTTYSCEYFLAERNSFKRSAISSVSVLSRLLDCPFFKILFLQRIVKGVRIEKFP